MILKSKHIVFNLLLNFFCCYLCGQNIWARSDTTIKTNYFQKIVPDFVKLQFAGGIGFISIGTGYSFFNNNLDVSAFYSYIPRSIALNDLHNISLQFNTKILRYKLNNKIELIPLTSGMFIHRTFGNKFWVTLPKHYPKGYYWWTVGRQAGAFVGSEVKTKILTNGSSNSGLAFYCRANVRMLNLYSKIGNSSISFFDIIECGFGITYYL